MNQKIFEEDTFSLTCQAIGKPIPEISWYFNNVLMTNSTRYAISEISLNPITKNSTITILSAKQSDMGTYKCNAINLASTSSSSVLMIVNGKCFVCTFNIPCGQY